MSDTKQSSGSSNVTTSLLLIFIVLKLTNNIDWSWWWVLSPLWIPLCVAIVFGVFAVLVSDAKNGR